MWTSLGGVFRKAPPVQVPVRFSGLAFRGALDGYPAARAADETAWTRCAARVCAGNAFLYSLIRGPGLCPFIIIKDKAFAHPEIRRCRKGAAGIALPAPLSEAF